MEVQVGYHVEYALKILIEASWRRRACELQYVEKPKIPRFLNDWCTVRMASARGSGHTHSLLSAAKLFNEPLLVFPTVEMGKHMMNQETAQAVSGGRYKKDRFLSVQQVDTLGRGLDCDAMLVDCAFHLRPKELEVISRHACVHLSNHLERFCLVLVG